MMKEKFFIVILGLQGHKRMGKTCAPKMLCFLRHPNLDPSHDCRDPDPHDCLEERQKETGFGGIMETFLANFATTSVADT